MVTFDELDFTDAGKSLKYVFNIFIIFVSEILGTEITGSKIEKKKKNTYQRQFFPNEN